ncbi:MAG: peroxiredoxin, partial [Alphaproteobacteria bacterium]|nr:peroxiredoxin [Alphaproteobacteria bacterium]
MADLDAGRPAPDFELPRDGGQTVRLSDFRGKIVVLFFYPKDDTTGCTAEAIDFTRNLPHFDSAGATVIGMSPDSVRRHERFKTKHNLGMPLVSDETHATLT